MVGLTEINRSLTGALRLLLGRRDGLLLLDRSVDGFWRSFAAIVLVIPLQAVALIAISRIAVQDPFADAFLQMMPPLVIGWIAFPAVLAGLARPLNLTRTYVTYVVARNWAAPISQTIVTVPLVLQGAGFIDEPLSRFVTVAAVVIALRYDWVVLRMALEANARVCAGLLVGDIALSFFIAALFS